MEEKEIWLPVPEFYGKYDASSFGRIRSNFRESKYGKRSPTGTILKFSITRRGYYHIGLSKWVNGNKVDKTYKVHRIICATFHPNPQNKPQVNHKDLNQLNNRADNLEWATAKENTNHAQKHGRRPIAVYRPPVGEHPRRLKKVRNRKTGEIIGSTSDLAKLWRMAPKYVCRVLNEERAPNKTDYEYVPGEYIFIYKNKQRAPLR